MRRRRRVIPEWPLGAGTRVAERTLCARPVDTGDPGARIGTTFAHVPAPRWFFRFMYDRESSALARRHDEADHRELDEATVDELARLIEAPGPVADLGCGPGPHSLLLARRGYDVIGIDGSPRMIEVARARAAREDIAATFRVEDLGAPLNFADTSLGGVLAVLVVQHLPDPAEFIQEIRRCLRPGGHLLIRAPVRRGRTGARRSMGARETSLLARSAYWRLRAAFYTFVPGVVRFYDIDSLRRLIEGQGMNVVESTSMGQSVTVVAHT